MLLKIGMSGPGIGNLSGGKSSSSCEVQVRKEVDPCLVWSMHLSVWMNVNIAKYNDEMNGCHGRPLLPKSVFSAIRVSGQLQKCFEWSV